MKDSRRKRLDEIANSGDLRQALERHSSCNDEEIINLIVDICARYCEPRRGR